jgi:uncharacterized membrane protein YoaK (UPF0700 family)
MPMTTTHWRILAAVAMVLIVGAIIGMAFTGHAGAASIEGVLLVVLGSAGFAVGKVVERKRRTKK